MSRNERPAAVTALREVAEEAGVRARPIRRLRRVEQKQEGEWICIAYFLMAYAGRTNAAREAQDPLARLRRSDRSARPRQSRRVLRSADRLISVPLRHDIRSAAARLAKRLVRAALALLPRRRPAAVGGSRVLGAW